MPNKNEWFETIHPLHYSENSANIERISQRVQEKLSDTAERKTMMKTSKTHSIRNIFFAIVAVLCVGTASVVTANAVTDGALFQKITVRLNGEDVEADVVQESTDENGNAIYNVVVDGSDWDIQANDNGEVAVEYNGGMDEDEVEIEVEVDGDVEAASD